MIAKLIPIVFLVLGMAVGASAALFMEKSGTPPKAEKTALDNKAPKKASGTESSETDGEGPGRKEYVRLANQFVVPVIERGKIRSLVILTISIETSPGHQEEIFAKQPKLRDSFLEVLFDYSNTGGFSGAFTDTTALQSLKADLTRIARHELGEFVDAVLIEDIMRQDK